MELDSSTTIREKISWIEDQPISWDKNQAWMRIERGADKEESAKRFGYYAAAAVVVMAVMVIVGGDYRRVETVGMVEGAEGMSNIERRISNVEVGTNADVSCGEVRTTLPERKITTAQIITPEVIEEITEPLVLSPEPVEGERIAVVEAPKNASPPVERVSAIFGVDQQPSVAIIRQGKKLKIHFLQTEISQSSFANVMEPSSLEARITKK